MTRTAASLAGALSCFVVAATTVCAPACAQPGAESVDAARATGDPARTGGAPGAASSHTGDPVGWTGWGGGRDWRLPAGPEPLRTGWGEAGPPEAWSRTLDGSGHGGVASAGGVVFVHVRDGDEDVAYALEAASGETLWRRATPCPARVELDYGPGPFTTPVVCEETVVFVGGTGLVRALGRRDGRPVWSVDLEERFSCPRASRGHGSTPLRHGDRLFLPVGARGASVVALDVDDGEVLWQRHGFDLDYASAVLCPTSGDAQLVCQMADEVVGLAPGDGRLLWRLPADGERTRHCMTPVPLAVRAAEAAGESEDGGGADAADVVAVTDDGCRALDLDAVDASGRPRIVWRSRRIRGQVGNVLYLPGPGLLVGPKSTSSGTPLVALRVADGRLAWRSRAVDVGFVWALGERLVSFDVDGDLVVASPSREGLEVEASARVLEGDRIWSAPAMADGRVFVKDGGRIRALSLRGG